MSDARNRAIHAIQAKAGGAGNDMDGILAAIEQVPDWKDDPVLHEAHTHAIHARVNIESLKFSIRYKQGTR